MAEADVRGAVLLGAVSGTNATQIIGTPCEIHSFVVFNAESSIQGAVISETEEAVDSLAGSLVFGSGATTVPTYGYELNEVWGRLAHTNMNILVFYTPYQLD